MRTAIAVPASQRKWLGSLTRSRALATIAASVLTIWIPGVDAFNSSTTALRPAETSAVLTQFLSRPHPTPTQYRALRHLRATNRRFNAEGWLDAWTELDARGRFTYQVIAEGGSQRIRDRALHALLAAEERASAAGRRLVGDITTTDYEFDPAGALEDGLIRLTVKPRRKDSFLVDGAIFVSPDAADLVRIEGRLSKSPSFWTRRVDVIRRYGRIAGVQVPLSTESTADIRIAGPSQLTITYEYESIDGQAVATFVRPAEPQLDKEKNP